MSLRPETSGMASSAHSWEPLKSCFLSAFLPQPKDQPGLGGGLAGLEQKLERQRRLGVCSPNLPRALVFLVWLEVLSVYSRPCSVHSCLLVTYSLICLFQKTEAAGELWIKGKFWTRMQQSRDLRGLVWDSHPKQAERKGKCTLLSACLSPRGGWFLHMCQLEVYYDSSFKVNALFQ